MRLQDILSKINNPQLRTTLCQIAAKDGGQNKNEIDTQKGYQQLCNLLSGDISKNDKDILLGLKVDYQSNNHIGNIGRDNNGNIVYGNGNAVGGANSINTSGDNNIIVTGNNNTLVINNSDNKKIKIKAGDEINGQTAAKEVYNETVDSWIAFNDRIVNSINNVNNKNAYSFFKEYSNLRNNNPNLFQDIFKVTDPRNVITNKQVSHLMKALLNQAKGLGLQESDSYKQLNAYYKAIMNSNADPEGSQSIQFDYAIDELLQKMSEFIK